MSKLSLSVQPKKKEIKLRVAKKRAWTAFSKYIRLRDSILTTGDPKRCICVTCGKEYPNGSFRSIQAGHFISGRHSAILFEETCCHGQCYNCNIILKGNSGAYTRYMKKRYGQKEIDRLLALDETTKNYTVCELLEIEKDFKLKIENNLLNKESWHNSWMLTASKEDIDNCICNEWDGKGVSVCGFPCPVHRKKKKFNVKKFVKQAKIVKKILLQEQKEGLLNKHD
jgi:hypothetical protein